MKKIRTLFIDNGTEIPIDNSFDLTQIALKETTRNKWIDQEIIIKEYGGVAPWYTGDGVYEFHEDGDCQFVVAKDWTSYQQKVNGEICRYEISYMIEPEEGDDELLEGEDYRNELRKKFNVRFDDDP